MLDVDLVHGIQFKNRFHVLSDNRSARFQPEAVLRLGRIFNASQSSTIRDTKNLSVPAVPLQLSLNGGQDSNAPLRILVLVMTIAANLQTKALAVKDTWGKRCDVLIFFSSESDKNFPAIGLGTPEGRGHLTAKTMAAFRYIYEYHFNDADWFMKADDDTFMIVENLRLFLASKNSSEPIYFGHLFKLYVKQGYYSGGGGYVISKEALRRFGHNAVNSDLCPQDGGAEDLNFGLCMERLGVVTSPSLDAHGRTLFHAVGTKTSVLDRTPSWLWRYTAKSPHRASDISKNAISFHYITPDEMRMLDFFLYHLKSHES
ncbi:hypothetical protein RRG08_027645 [Elysia crispata]|uniref:N-acetylgalactosaminide beta-1,3-galactosyltransferase n=1 Tax=Elysia crispata TaxID=231223 RepID=A0AAE0XM31_9GAST|nr:hypothetical protein RRG08_027645 [Elysia crispata]